MKFKAVIEGRNGLLIAVIVPTFVCFVFPTANSSQDAWAYAAGAKWGNDLFMPHHLLYTAQLFLISKIFTFYDVLLLGKHLNALYVCGALLVFRKLLSQYTTDIAKVNTATFFVGVSFAVLRFGTENETYIAPIFYSLFGSYLLAQFETRKKYIFIMLSGFFLAFACLLHQIQVFWWLSIFIYLIVHIKSIGLKSVIYFTLPAFIIPIFYSFVLVYYRNESLTFFQLFQFVFETFYTGSSQILFDETGVFRFLAAIVRCFMQLHSYIYVSCETYSFLYPIAILIILAIGYFTFKLSKTLRLNKYSKLKHTKLYLVLLLVQLGFGLFCYGNSEMMVAIPFLTVLLMIFIFEFSSYYLLLLSISLFMWNLVFGLILNNRLVFSTHNYLARQTQAKKDAVFYLRYATEINDIIYYNTGNLSSNCKFPKCINSEKTKNEIDSLLKSNKEVFTDFIEKGIIKNSTSMIFDEVCGRFFENYKATKADSAHLLGNYENLYILKLK